MNRYILVLLALFLFLAGCGKNEAPQAQNPDQTQPPAQEQTNPPESPEDPSQANPEQGKPSQDDTNKDDDDDNDQPPPKPPAASKPLKTKPEAFEQVDFLMTYEEVAKIMGGLGKLIHTEGDYNAGNLLEVYEYESPDGKTTYKITFRNGKMNNKSSASRG